MYERINNSYKTVFAAALAALTLGLSSCSKETDSPSGPSNTGPQALTVVSVTPADGNTSASVSASISAVFSRAIDASTVTTGTFFVEGVSGSVSASGSTATFTPSSSLSENTSYTVNITGAIKAADGGALASAFSSTFKTSIAPVASAGDDVDASLAETVSLSATSNLGASAVYTWTQVAGPSVGALSGATPSFTAPDQVSTLMFELTVSDGANVSGADRVMVFVLEDKNNTIWVDASGDDNNAGTRSAPKASIQAAIDAARAGGAGADVYVGSGTYAQALNLAADVSVYGGYDAMNWLRD